MKTTTKHNFNYNNEALFRLAKIYLSKFDYDLNQFYVVRANSGTIVLQGHIEDNIKLLSTDVKKEVDDNTVSFNIGNYLKIYLTATSYLKTF